MVPQPRVTQTRNASRQADVRLPDAARQVIRQTVAEIFGPEAKVLLFGSRTDPKARGGDIDLLVVSDKPVADRERKALTLVARLQIRLGDQPIDALVLDPQTRHPPSTKKHCAPGFRYGLLRGACNCYGFSDQSRLLRRRD